MKSLRPYGEVSGAKTQILLRKNKTNRAEPRSTRAPFSTGSSNHG